jgi:hypothetical protein
MDGGYVDNSAIAFTLASTQRDCLAGALDCSEPIKLIEAMDTGYPELDKTTRFLFAGSGHSPGDMIPSPNWPLVTIPAPVIFDGDVPAEGDGGWAPYATTELYVPPLGVNVTQRFSSAPDTSNLNTEGHHLNFTSWVWQGERTTVENKFYGVSAGQQVKILMFVTNIPRGVISAEPMLMPPAGSSAFATQSYGPIAAAQAEGVAPVIRAFMEEE